MTLNIQAYFDKGNNLVGADAYRMPWNLIRGDGCLLRSLSDNQDNYAQAPDEATQVLDLRSCELNGKGQLKKIKEVTVVRGNLDDMREQHPEIMKILMELSDKNIHQNNQIGDVQVSLKEFRSSIQSTIDKAIEQVKESQEIPERLYYVKMPSPFDNNLTGNYLNRNTETNSFLFSTSSESRYYKTKFTSDELDEIQKHLPFLNIGMLKIPVEDDE